MLRGDEIGLFWEDIVEVKEPSSLKKIKEPVVLKPYRPRPSLCYELMTDDNIVTHQGSTLIVDTECFANFFLIAFKHTQTKKVILLTIPFDSDKLAWILRHYTCVGFNILKYDLPLIWLARQEQDTEVLKLASNDLIAGLYYKQVQQRYQFQIHKTPCIDLIDVCPLHGGLKLYGARLHARRIQDVPWAAEQWLEDWQIPITTDYCVNDLNTTELLFDNLTEQLQLRANLSKEYNQDLMSKSDSQIAEAVIGSELKRLTGRYPSRPKIKSGTVHHFVPPANLTFKTDYMQNVLKTISQANFQIAENGYLIRPKEIENLGISLGNSLYRMGIGGLHSSEKATALLANDEHIVIDYDVASYYPSICLNCQLIPKNLGPQFLTVYRSLVERRLEAKRLKNLAASENLKVTINGTFGKTGSPHSILYAPEVIIQILLGGQLYLLMLIEWLELAGIPVASANTDGIIIRCPIIKKDIMAQVIKDWEQTTGFVTEQTQYKAIYARDVNAYLAIKTNDEVKGKNIFYDPWRDTNARDRYWRFQKNPTCQICIEAIEKFILKRTPIDQTIYACIDITRFIAVKNVTGGAHWDGEYLGKVVRWYYAKDVVGTINYINSNRIVADSEGAKPLMDLPDTLPNDIDYQRYIDRCQTMLIDMGWKPD